MHPLLQKRATNFFKPPEQGLFYCPREITLPGGSCHPIRFTEHNKIFFFHALHFSHVSFFAN